MEQQLAFANSQRCILEVGKDEMALIDEPPAGSLPSDVLTWEEDCRIVDAAVQKPIDGRPAT